MDIIYAIFMGIIQGATEFLPVSSSGHLALFQHIFKTEMGTGILFECMLHLGTLIAVCIVFWTDVKNLVIHGIALIIDAMYNCYCFFMNKFFKKDLRYRRLVNTAYRKFAALIIVSSIPTAVLGVLLKGLTESADHILLIPAVGLLITAIELFLIDGRRGGRKKLKLTSYKDAGIIGIVQGLATIPGVSRSGSTITACMFLGLDKSLAVKYSFLMSVPAIVGANLISLKDLNSESITAMLIISYIIGMIVAGIVGYICVKVMLNIVKKSNYRNFAFYCMAIGLISLIVYFFI